MPSVETPQRTSGLEKLLDDFNRLEEAFKKAIGGNRSNGDLPTPTSNSTPIPSSGSSNSTPFTANGGGQIIDDLSGLGNVQIITQEHFTPESSGDWTPYRMANPRDLVGQLQPISLDQRRQLEAYAATAKNRLEETKAGVAALVELRGHEVGINKEILGARARVAQLDAQDISNRTNAVISMMKTAPGIAATKAELMYQHGEQRHQQRVKVLEAVPAILQAMGGG
jgi:hypothetical protein